MKIAVIGYSGAGKSTLAKRLGLLYGCPVMHLDKVQFTAGWQERALPVAQQMARDFMEHQQWVIDGNYRQFYQQRRLKEADMIVFLDFPALVCLWRVWLRFCQYRKRTREDMADGCLEKLDMQFVKWILFDGRTKAYKEQYRQVIAEYPQKSVVLKNRHQGEDFWRQQQKDI